MMLFGWMQNKLTGKQLNAVPITNHKKQEPREEFSDWPHSLLAIGTFGNSDLRANPENIEIEENLSSSNEIVDFTPEEVGKLQKELTKLLSKKPNSDLGKQLADLPLDRFLNCPSSLEVDRRISHALCADSDDKDEDIERTINIILGKCKDITSDNKKKMIGKKSIAFLLKKMFVCSSGFAPTPSLRDTLQESKMERLLRTFLHKKINPQNSSRASSMKKYLEGRQASRKEEEDERKEKISDGCKWVKTDSEFIVLEI